MNFKNLLLIILLNQTYIFCADIKKSAEQRSNTIHCKICKESPHNIEEHIYFIEFIFSKGLYKEALLKGSETLLLLPKDKYKYNSVEICFEESYISITDILHCFNYLSRIMLCKDQTIKNQLIFEYYNLHKGDSDLLKGIFTLCVKPLGFNDWEGFEDYYKKQNYKPLTAI